MFSNLFCLTLISLWLGGKPTTKVQSDHNPVSNRYCPRSLRFCLVICQSKGLLDSLLTLAMVITLFSLFSASSMLTALCVMWIKQLISWCADVRKGGLPCLAAALRFTCAHCTYSFITSQYSTLNKKLQNETFRVIFQTLCLWLCIFEGIFYVLRIVLIKIISNILISCANLQFTVFLGIMQFCTK